MSYKTEFPDYDGEFRVPDGFVDASWHNDMMPRALKRFIKGESSVEFNIWQDYLNPNNREDSSGKRFIFSVELDTEEIFYYTSDDWEIIEQMAKETPKTVYGWKKEL